MESLTRTLFMSIVHRLSETASLQLNYTYGILWNLFWRISTRYRSCIFHSCIFSAPISFHANTTIQLQRRPGDNEQVKQRSEFRRRRKRATHSQIFNTERDGAHVCAQNSLTLIMITNWVN